MVCGNFILPELCKPCLFLCRFQFAQLIVPYPRYSKSGGNTQTRDAAAILRLLRPEFSFCLFVTVSKSVLVGGKEIYVVHTFSAGKPYSARHTSALKCEPALCFQLSLARKCKPPITRKTIPKITHPQMGSCSDIMYASSPDTAA